MAQSPHYASPRATATMAAAAAAKEKQSMDRLTDHAPSTLLLYDDNGADTSTPTRDSTGRSNDTDAPWMGAFERVMGDQADVFGSSGNASSSSSSTTHSSKQFNATSLRSHDSDERPTTSEGGQKSSGVERANGAISTVKSPRRRSISDAPSITITPDVIDFGMANVGTRKSAFFHVHNQSASSTARIQLRYVSKVVSMNRDEIEIAPNQSVELRVDFFPRRVNEQYRKQVTVANLKNRANDQILEVRSTNVDGQRIGFHSLFYRILTPTGSNFVDFGDVNINCTRLRTFGIENVSSAPLSLELSAANTEDLKLYVKCIDGSSRSSGGASRRSSVTKYSSIDDGTASTPSEALASNDAASKLLVSKAKRTAHLKEKFLDSMNYDVPASARNENKSWRLAQKQSHVVKGGKANAQGAHKADTVVKKPHINLVAALKKGGKGRLTQRYGKSICFKDRTLLSDFEYLDLATGPPVDGKRISVKSRKYMLLDAHETGKSAGGTSRTKSGGTASPARRLPGNGSLADALNAGASSQRSDSESRRPSPALTGKRKAGPMLHDAIDVSELSLDELLAAVEAQNSSLSTVFLSNARAEEQLVRTEVNLQRELRSAINEGRLLPVDVLTLEPNEEKQVLAIYTPNGSTRPHIQGNARKQDSRIFFRLVDFGTQGLRNVKEDFQKLLQTDRDELPVRDLMVKSNLCRSLMELSQPHINFGHLQKGETKTRKIVVQNRSELALRYCIRKSGSIASGDIKLKSADRYGIVPGHGKREVEFVFCPSLTGVFQERLTVENVADRDRDETVLIKANVTRVSNFLVEPSLLYTEDVLLVGECATNAYSFMLTNVSSKTRSFSIAVEADDLRHGAYHVEVILSASINDDGIVVKTKAQEEEVEHISQKLKIANRKGQTDKIQKYHDRLTELGVSLDDKSLEDEDATAALGATTENQKLRVASSVTVSVAAQQSKRFFVRLRPLRVLKPDSEHHYHHDVFDVRIPIQVHEAKNIDEVQVVEIRSRVQAASTAAIVQESNDDLTIALPSKEEATCLFTSQRALSGAAATAASPFPTTAQDIVSM